MYSQQTASYYGGDRAQARVEDHALGFYHALVQARIAFDMMHDHLLDPAHVGRYRTLILPNIAALSETQCRQLADFVDSGGSIVATHESSLYDEWGVRRADFGLASVFGASLAGKLDADVHNSYLNIDKDSSGRFHPLVHGLEDAGRIINGVQWLHTRPAQAGYASPLTLLPSFPDLPMESVYPRVPHTDVPGVYAREEGRGRVVYFPFDIDRTYWDELHNDSHMAPEKAVYVLVVEGFADWEPAHALAELRRHGQYRVESVGLTLATVESMGGIRVLPSTIVAKVDTAARELLEELNVLSAEDRAAWAAIFRSARLPDGVA